MNRLRLEGDQNRIDELLKSVKGKDSVLDFNRIIPMPESLNIEAGSRTDNGLKAYKDFVYVYTFAGIEKKDLLNIPKEKRKFSSERGRISDAMNGSSVRRRSKTSRNTAWRHGTSGRVRIGEQNGRLITRNSAKITRSCSTRHGRGQCP